jgi:hypothetical protein
MNRVVLKVYRTVTSTAGMIFSTKKAGNFRFTVSPRPHQWTACFPTKSARRVENLVRVKQLQRETDSYQASVAKVNDYGSWMWCSNKSNSKDTAIPIQTWTGQKGTRMVRLRDLKTIGT